MDNERKRILGMLAAGTISIEECEELLEALSARRSEKVTREVRAVQSERPVWPYALLVGVLVVGVLGTLGLLMLGGEFARRGFDFVPFHGWSRGVFMFPVILFGGLIKTAAFVFWVWMLVDCIMRMPCDFRLLFTSRHEYDKWIWVALIVLTNWIGALVYLFVIRRRPRTNALVTPVATPADGSAPAPAPRDDFTPSPRSGSLIPFFILGVFLATVAAAVLLFIPQALGMQGRFTWAFTLAVGMGIPMLWLTVFWVWMLIDCLARDHRDFGMLFTRDSSADKVLWLLLILFLSFIGALAYHVAVRRRIRPEVQAA